jgi:Txe/YoeB family toxin of Txe-Axe toxin-antitoxin module
VRLIVFHQTAFDDYSNWSKLDRKIFDRVRRIIIETAKSPSDGIGDGRSFQ